MMNSKQVFFGLLVCIAALTSCDTRKQVAVGNELSLTRAKQTLDSLYQNYSAPGTCLLREIILRMSVTTPQPIWHPKNKRICPTNTPTYGLIPAPSPQ